MKTCSLCHQEKPRSDFLKHPETSDNLGSWCKFCRCEYMRQYRQSAHGRERITEGKRRYKKTEKCREAQRRYRENRPLRYAARMAVTVAIQTKEIPPASDLSCFCGAPAAEYHHRDYAKPLEVDPLCTACHYEIHRIVKGA